MSHIPRSKGAKPPGDRRMDARAYAAQIIAARLKRMMSHAEGVKKGIETEPVHQMRVWSRRSRAAMEIFAPCFPGQAFGDLEGEIKSVTHALGAARDLDVMIVALQGRAETLPLELRVGVVAFIESLKKQRKDNQKTAMSAVVRLEKRDIVRRFAALAAKRPAAHSGSHGRRVVRGAKARSRTVVDPRETLFVNAAYAVRVRLAAMLEYESCLTRPDLVRELHAMRTEAKRLRYTMDIFQEVFVAHTRSGAAFVTALEAVRGLQDHLGAIHDADVLVPKLTARIHRAVEDGYGMNRRGEEIIGVHCVDFDSAQGLLTLCRETVALRDARYESLIADWKKLQDDRVFDTLRTLLNAVAEDAETPVLGELPADLTEMSAPETESPAAPIEDETKHEEARPAEEPAAAKTRTRRASAKSAAVETVSEAAASKGTGGTARRAANTRRPAGAGSDTPASVAKSGTEQPPRPPRRKP